MLSTLVMTVIGPDRPGLVELLTSHVAQHGGNWLESRMCHLGGQFAGIVRVEIPSDKTAALAATLASLEKNGLRVTATQEPAVAAPAPAGPTTTLELIGQDRPGILHQVSGILARHAVNVEELTSDRVDAPIDGSRLFKARATVRLPAGVSNAQLRTELEAIAADLMVDIRLEPPKP